jgi:hypothetical protein
MPRPAPSLVSAEDRPRVGKRAAPPSRPLAMLRTCNARARNEHERVSLKHVISTRSEKSQMILDRQNIIYFDADKYDCHARRYPLAVLSKFIYTEKITEKKVAVYELSAGLLA